MNLHRATAEAEWQKIPNAERNSWQRTAAMTAGIVTPGNLTTVIGLIIAVVGVFGILHEEYVVGLIGLSVGRLLDILDGYVADKTGTKSPLGEATDASVDKLVTLLTLIVLTTTGVIEVWMLVALLVPHALITILSMSAVLRGMRLHPSRSGKLSMAFAWLALIGMVAAAAFSDINGIYSTGLALGSASVLLAVVALAGYLKNSLTK